MWTDLLHRLRSLFWRSRVEQELDDEIRFHIDHLVATHRRAGLSQEEAMRRARLEFGGVDQVKEAHRDARGVRLLDDVGRDVAYAARQIRRSPGFAALAMLCLGLGIGVNIAIFSVINAFLLRPLPVSDADRLVMISRADSAGLTYAAYRDFKVRTQTLSGLTASFPTESDFDIDGDSDFVVSEVVDGDYAQVLGVSTALGRWFIDEREPAAVISYAVWEQRFNLSPDVLGRRIRSGSESYTIAGVAPREFSGVYAPMRTDIWIPLRTRVRLAPDLERRDSRLLVLPFGRLRAGGSPAQAAAELNAIDARLAAEQSAATERPAPMTAMPARGIVAGTRRVALAVTTLMAGVVGIVLLIACVNVGNLLLVRGALRQRELAMRRALGASRLRLLRQLLIETLLLAVGGGICGVVTAFWTTRLLQRSFPATIGVFAMHLDLSLDRRAVIFAVIITLITTVICGLLPAWRSSQVRGLVAFKGEIGAGPPRRRPIGLVAQVILSLVLLFIAGSFVQGLLQLQVTDPGFDATGRVYAYTWLPSPPATPPGRRAVYQQALDRLRALPGVHRASMTSSLPLMPAGSECAALAGSAQTRVTSSAVESGFFPTLGIDLVQGRDFTADDPVDATAPAVIVNESLARVMWRGRSAVGERLLIGCKDAQPAIVLGVARDSAVRAVGEVPQPHVYRRLTPEFAALIVIMLEGTDAAALVQPVRQTLLSQGDGLRVYDVQPLSVHVDQSYAEVRWLAGVLTVFGALALLLAAIGVYGLIAYRVTQRTQEIGVRMALGASRRDVFHEVIRHGLAVVLVGVAIGEALTFGLTGVVAAVQEGIQRTGVMTHIVVAVIWIAVALLACCLPAARASRVDPLVALRYE